MSDHIPMLITEVEMSDHIPMLITVCNYFYLNTMLNGTVSVFLSNPSCKDSIVRKTYDQ